MPGTPGAIVAVGVTEAEAEDAEDVPTPLVAVAVNVYAVPDVSPATTHDDAGTITVHEPTDALLGSHAVTVYELAVPPGPAGTVTVTDPGPDTTVGVPGIPGAAKFTELEAVDADDVPPTLLAVVVNVYDVPSVNPVTSHDVNGATTVHERTGLVPTAVTVYDDAGPPDDGGVTVTVADVVDVTTTLGVPGRPGVANGITGADATEADDVPAALVAVEENVYVVPLVSAKTVHDVAGVVTVQLPADTLLAVNAVTKYDAGALPEFGAATVTVAEASLARTVGGPGGPGAIVTDTVAAFESVVPPLLLTCTRYCRPESDPCSAGVVYDAVVAPEPPVTFTHVRSAELMRVCH